MMCQSLRSIFKLFHRTKVAGHVESKLNRLKISDWIVAGKNGLGSENQAVFSEWTVQRTKLDDNFENNLTAILILLCDRDL